jgi:drug/metabolite transporter (DMT)-like permease
LSCCLGYSIYAQSFGQRRVDPTDANLIYTIQPIFTALFAYFLLGETLGPAGFVGGSLIGVAVYLIAASEQGGNDDNAAPASVETKLSGTLAVTSQPTAEIEGDSIPSS